MAGGQRLVVCCGRRSHWSCRPESVVLDVVSALVNVAARSGYAAAASSRARRMRL